MKVLVTGADGFVGTRLVDLLTERGHDVVAAVRPDRPLYAVGAPPPWIRAVRTVPLEVLDETSVRAALGDRLDWLVHLAAVASGAEARRDPEGTHRVNVGGTVNVARELARQRRGGEADVRLLFISTAEVYGPGPEEPRVETDSVSPRSPYAESKWEAEKALAAIGRDSALDVVVARPFPHTGAGQDRRFVVPAFARRMLDARERGVHTIKVGNLTPVREFLHVLDVVDAYLKLLEEGESGQTYNVASGRGLSLAEVFAMLAEIIGHRVEPEQDPELVRQADIAYLVGDATKLRERTGWSPQRSVEEALAEVVDAQAD